MLGLQCLGVKGLTEGMSSRELDAGTPVLVAKLYVEDNVALADP